MAQVIRCAECNEHRRHYSGGRCKTCYWPWNARNKAKDLKECKACGAKEGELCFSMIGGPVNPYKTVNRPHPGREPIE